MDRRFWLGLVIAPQASFLDAPRRRVLTGGLWGEARGLVNPLALRTPLGRVKANRRSVREGLIAPGFSVTSRLKWCGATITIMPQDASTEVELGTSDHRLGVVVRDQTPGEKTNNPHFGGG
jgi:hypothetical protein